MKFLLAGDVNGNFDVLEKRVKKLNQSKHGPFDAVLCVGNFFKNEKDSTTLSTGVEKEDIHKVFIVIFICSTHVILRDRRRGEQDGL